MKQEDRELINWHYGRVPLDADPAGFGPLRDIVQLWRDKMDAQGGLPTKRAFDFFDFRGWWGKVAISKVERDPFDIRFVLWGTQLSEWWGVDYTNKRLGEASIVPEVWDAVELAYFGEMDRAPFIGVVSGYLDQHERPFIKVMGVDLPLSDGGDGAARDGRQLSHVLTVHIQAELDDTIESVFPDLKGLSYF